MVAVVIVTVVMVVVVVVMVPVAVNNNLHYFLKINANSDLRNNKEMHTVANYSRTLALIDTKSYTKALIDHMCFALLCVRVQLNED